MYNSVRPYKIEMKYWLPHTNRWDGKVGKQPNPSRNEGYCKMHLAIDGMT